MQRLSTELVQERPHTVMTFLDWIDRPLVRWSAIGFGVVIGLALGNAYDISVRLEAVIAFILVAPLVLLGPSRLDRHLRGKILDPRGEVDRVDPSPGTGRAEH